MRSLVTRSAFAATLCAGVAMVGASVHGLMGVDAELERSAVAAQLEREPDRSRFTVFTRHDGWDCPGRPRDPQV
jgi:hypothetical protein